MLEVLYDADQCAGLSRDQLVTALSWEGVPLSPTAVIGQLIYEHPSLRDFFDQPCPTAKRVMDQLLVFGHPLQSLVFQADESKIDLIIEKIEMVYEHREQIAAHFNTI